MSLKQISLAVLWLSVLCAAGPVSRRQSRVQARYEDVGALNSGYEDEVVPPPGLKHPPWSKRSVSEEASEMQPSRGTSNDDKRANKPETVPVPFRRDGKWLYAPINLPETSGSVSHSPPETEPSEESAGEYTVVSRRGIFPLQYPRDGKWPLVPLSPPWIKRSVPGDNSEVEILYEQPVSAEIVYGERAPLEAHRTKHSIPEEDTEVEILHEQPVSAELVYGEKAALEPVLREHTIPEEATEKEISRTSTDIPEIAVHAAENGPILEKCGFDIRKYYCSPRNPWKIWIGLWIGLCYDYKPNADDPQKVDPQFNLMDETEFGFLGPLEGTWEFGVYPDWSTVDRPGVKVKFHGEGVVAEQSHAKRGLRKRNMAMRGARRRVQAAKSEEPKRRITESIIDVSHASMDVTEIPAEDSSTLSKRGFKKVWCNYWNPFQVNYLVWWIFCKNHHHHYQQVPDPQFNLYGKTEFGKWVIKGQGDVRAFNAIELPPGVKLSWEESPYHDEKPERRPTIPFGHWKRSNLPSMRKSDLTPNIFQRGFKSLWCDRWNPARLNIVVKWINMRVCYEDPTPLPDAQFNLSDETEFGMWVVEAVEDESAASTAPAPYEVVEIPPGGGEMAWDYPDGNPHHRHGGGYPKEVMVLFAPLKHQRGKRGIGGARYGELTERELSQASPDILKATIDSSTIFGKRDEVLTETKGWKKAFIESWCRPWNPANLWYVMRWIDTVACRNHFISPPPDGQFNLFNVTEFGIWDVAEMYDGAYNVVEIAPGDVIAWKRPIKMHHRNSDHSYSKHFREYLARLANLSPDELETVQEKEPNNGRDWHSPFVPKHKPHGKHHGDEDEDDHYDGKATRATTEPEEAHILHLHPSPPLSSHKAVVAKRTEHPYGLLAKCIFTFGFKCRQHPGDKWFPNHDGTMPAKSGVNDYKDEGGACNDGNWAEGCCTKDEWGCPHIQIE